MEPENNGTPTDFPWLRTLHEEKTQTGAMLRLKIGPSERRSYLINSALIVGGDGTNRGVLASFEDVTEMETKKTELGQMLEVLQTSRDEVRKKNDELQILATRDPLTSCLNRRSFYEQFKTHWNTAKRYGQPLSCVLLDIDHFKSINDTHGHRPAPAFSA